MEINETQAVTLAKQWLKNNVGKELPLSDVYFMPKARAEEVSLMFDQPASWMVIFQANTSENIELNRIGININQETGEIMSMPL